MTRSLRARLGLVATAALLAGCAMSPQPQTISVPNPLAALNGVLTAPSVPTYTTALPAGVSYQQAAPASYASYVPGGYNAPVQATYGALNQTYTAANSSTVFSAPTISAPTYSAPTVLNSSAYTVQSSLPSYSVPSYNAPSIPTLGSIAPAPQSYSTAAISTPVQSYAAPVQTISSLPAPSYTASIPTLGSVQPVQATGTTYDITMPVQDTYAAPAPSLVSNSYSYGASNIGASSYGASIPAPSVVQPVQATGTTYDLTGGSSYGASLTPAQATVPSMGGSFQVVPPSTASLGNGVATYSPTLGAGLLN